VGSGAYAAANAYLDGLMARRRAAGLPGLSINWGPWAEIGMSAAAAPVHQRMGLDMIASDDGIAALLGLLAAGSATPAQVGVVAANWQHYCRSMTGAIPDGYFDDLTVADAEHSITRPPEPWGATVLRDLLEDVDPLGALAGFVEAELREILRAGGPVDRYDGFVDLGMDSLMAVELRDRLCGRLGLDLPATIAFKCANIAELTAFLATELGLDTAPEVTAPAPSPAEPDAHDLMARLAAKYESAIGTAGPAPAPRQGAR
jgi:hypothetical protein